MSQPAFCEKCALPIYSNSCTECGAPSTNSESKVFVSDIDSPGDNQSVLLKRYKIAEQKRIVLFPGFKLYSNKNDGNGWKLVEERDEIEGKNKWLKLLFGKEEVGYVYYVNTQVLSINFDWLVPFNGETYRVNSLIELEVNKPELFISGYLGKEIFLLDELAATIEGSAKERMKIVLSVLGGEVIDFAKCQNDIQARCQDIILDKGIDIISVVMNGEVEVDLELERLEADKAAVTHERELLAHKADEENLTEQHIDTKVTETKLKKAENELTLKLDSIEKDKNIRIAKANSEYEALEGEWKVTKKGIELETKENVAKIEGETETKLAQIRSQTKIEEGSFVLDEAVNNRSKLNVKHSVELLAVLEGEEQGSKDSDELREFEKAPKLLKRFSEVVNIPYSDGLVCNSREFGEYFWNQLTKESGELEYLLNNSTLHYVRYEDNYCNSIEQIVLLYQILKQLKHYGCYVKAISETHLLFGYKQENTPGIFHPYARNKTFTQLFKHDGHLAASIKNSLHDREITLVFKNEAKVKFKLTYGLGFWKIDSNKLSDIINKSIKKTIEQKDVSPELVGEIKKVDLPVFNNEKKDTTAAVWGYIPVDSKP